MAGWTAANVNPPKRRRDEVGGSDGASPDRRGSGGAENKRRRRRSAETTEAALARLSSSYNAAMTAVGALHRASAAIARTAASSASNRTAHDGELSGAGSKPRGGTAAGEAGTSEDAAMLDDDTTGRAPESRKDDDASVVPQTDSIGQLCRVAKAARNALGGAILLDPIVRAYAPTWCQTVEELGREVGGGRGEPAALTSSAHRATVKELAYLVLVNYADLLTCGCCCSPPVDRGRGILDRGTVKVLEAFKCCVGGNCSSCCWSGEAAEDTKRLALVAYCDASDLDGSDPTLWLKVACTARALGTIVARRRAATSSTPPDSAGQGDATLPTEGAAGPDTVAAPPPTLLSYHRLERYALESGLSCLAPGVPPNRTIVRALRELQVESDHSKITQYPSILSDDRPKLVELVIDLPRYSWSAFGRILMRACREGSAYRSHDHGHEHIEKADKFGSPCINIRISPLLTLPPAALGTVCEFLGSETLSRDVKNLECTCRALSVEIISARAAMEKERHQRMLLMEQEMMRDFLNEDEDEERESFVPRGERRGKGGGRGNGEKKNGKKTGDKGDKPSRSHRSSKRVLSQLITSGKQAERTAKRKSVEYCLVSVVFSCTTEHPTYTALLKKKVDWAKLAPLASSHVSQSSAHFPKSPNTPTIRAQGSEASPTKEILARRIAESSARNGTSSLQSFILQWSKRNSGPIDVLSRFVSHVSCHVDGVFSSETGAMMVLSSCVMDCFDLLTKRCGYRESLAPCWYGEESFPAEGPYTEVIKAFAINLLNAELRLRRCERHVMDFDGYEDDAVCVSFMIPKLLRFLNEIKTVMSESTLKEKEVRALEIRCHWLAAIFYTWWSRKSAQLADVREAEATAMHHIDAVIECLTLTLSGPNPLVVRTPHLESPGRSGGHWKELSLETVVAYRNELQASLVVSRARHQFQELKFHKKGQQTEGQDAFSEQERVSLTDIGNELLERYGIDYEGLGGKHEELMIDFLTFHGTEIDLISIDDSVSNDENKTASKDSSVKSSSKWGSLWNLIPSSSEQLDKLRSSSDPSLVSILVVCLQAREDRDAIALSLLSRLAFAALDQYDYLSRQAKDTSTTSDADDDSSVSSSDSEDESSNRGQSGHSKGKGRTSLLTARFLIEKLAEIVSTSSDPNCIGEYAVGRDFVAMMHKALILSSGKEDSSSTQEKLTKSPPDFNLFLSISSLISALLRRLAGNDEILKQLKSSTFIAFVELFIKMRQIFPVLVRSKGDSRLGRSERQAVCLAYAEYVSSVATEMACLLTQNQSILHPDGRLEGSYLLKAAVEASQKIGPEKKEPSDVSPIVQLTESILWFWKFIVSADVFEGVQDITSPRSGVVSASSIDRAVAKCLVVSIAAFITSLCGATGQGNLVSQDEQQGIVSLSDFCDTDDSANGWSDEGSDDERPSHTSRRSLLRILVQSVQCCGLVFGGISDTVACSNENEHLSRFSPSTKIGPLLPIVVVRTLTHIADVLLTAFGSVDLDRRGAVWAEQYPYGARSAGIQLDSLLHKAYRYLHGFALVGQNNQANLKKDLVCPSLMAQTPLVSSKFKHYAPESTKAAARLYRCIRRAYPSKGRRSPPKAALECVSSALPPAQETERSKAIRNFVFSSDSHTHTTVEEEEGSLFDDNAKTVELLSTFPQWVLDEQQDKEAGTSNEIANIEVVEDSSQLNSGDEVNDEDEIRHVRKGICEELAQGSLPRLGSGTTTISNASPTKDDDQTKPKNESVERESTAQHEKALYRKFLAILAFLCYEPTDADAWYRASLCLGFKADIICDRLTSISDGYKGTDSFIPGFSPTENASFPLPKLLKDQKEAHNDSLRGWIPYLGNDLSHYIRYPWSTLSTLRSCSKKIKESVSENDCSDTACDDSPDPQARPGRANCDRSHFVWNEIDSMFENGDFAKWEKAWGGIFVAALHAMSNKCFSIALYLSSGTERPSNVEDDLFYELAETAGTSQYAELMGSTIYGYPMQLMTNFQKRSLASSAKAQFEAAIGFATSRDLEENVYDLHFMVGKCEEKIAKTLDREAFSSKDESSSGRAYEKLMKKALASYSTGLEEAKRVERVRNLPDVQAGGSSHGIPEIVYRLHASRLKVLLSAVRRRSKENRQMAELEALRITRAHWFVNSNQDNALSTSKGLRDEVWEVLADVVAAMAQLRIDNQFFHRSVYRHAVALLWAPVLHDPESGFIEGSLGSVPATKSYHLRGLNAGACVNSAQAVINALFDKKRQQLCGVWVATTATPSPFEVLNDAVRKYDALRSKYVGAYIDIMRLCKRKDTLLTFLGWADSCQRDLPTFYEASAALKGAAPDRFHTTESLLKGTGFLWTTKRRVNNAIADIILQEIAELGSTNDDVVTKRMDILKDAYSCFLRMNCPVNDKSWRAEKIEEGKVLEVEAVCKAYDALIGEADGDEMQSSDSPSWERKMSQLQIAVEKCQEMFPALGPQKKRAKRKLSRSLDEARGEVIEQADGKGTEVNHKDSSLKTPQSLCSPETPKAPTSKRRAKMVVVAVPEGLKEGDTFEHIFKDGSADKKVTLTIPAGNPSKLKFRAPRQSRSPKSKPKGQDKKGSGSTPGDEKKESNTSR